MAKKDDVNQNDSVADGASNQEAAAGAAEKAAGSVVIDASLQALIENAVAEAVAENTQQLISAFDERLKDAVAQAMAASPAAILSSTDKAVPGITLTEALALVKRPVVIPPKEKGDDPVTLLKAIQIDEVLDWNDLGSRVVIVTVDGQKFYGDKA